MRTKAREVVQHGGAYLRLGDLTINVTPHDAFAQ
jgi:hypothetical protein